MSRQIAAKNANQVSSHLMGEIQKLIYHTNKYFAEAFTLKCYPDLLASGLFPDVKEFTESMAAFAAVEQFAKIRNENLDSSGEPNPFHVGNKDVKMFDVCCGSSPRTAGVFAFRTAWKCLGIYPNLNPKWAGQSSTIKRLAGFKGRIESAQFETDKPIVITNVHGHAKSDLILESFPNSPLILLVNIPCCHPIYPKNKTPDMVYEDFGIWSPKREVRIDLIRRLK